MPTQEEEEDVHSIYGEILLAHAVRQQQQKRQRKIEDDDSPVMSARAADPTAARQRKDIPAHLIYRNPRVLCAQCCVYIEVHQQYSVAVNK